MDRDFIVKVCNDFYIRRDVTLVNKVLWEYCTEHNKKPEDIQKFLTYIFSTMSWLPFFEEALAYYERKFAIHKLWSSPDFNLLNNQGQRKLLLIF